MAPTNPLASPAGSKRSRSSSPYSEDDNHILVNPGYSAIIVAPEDASLTVTSGNLVTQRNSLTPDDDPDNDHDWITIDVHDQVIGQGRALLIHHQVEMMRAATPDAKYHFAIRRVIAPARAPSPASQPQDCQIDHQYHHVPQAFASVLTQPQDLKSVRRPGIMQSVEVNPPCLQETPPREDEQPPSKKPRFMTAADDGEPEQVHIPVSESKKDDDDEMIINHRRQSNGQSTCHSPLPKPAGLAAAPSFTPFEDTDTIQDEIIVNLSAPPRKAATPKHSAGKARKQNKEKKTKIVTLSYTPRPADSQRQSPSPNGPCRKTVKVSDDRHTSIYPDFLHPQNTPEIHRPEFGQAGPSKLTTVTEDNILPSRTRHSLASNISSTEPHSRSVKGSRKRRTLHQSPPPQPPAVSPSRSQPQPQPQQQGDPSRRRPSFESPGVRVPPKLASPSVEHHYTSLVRHPVIEPTTTPTARSVSSVRRDHDPDLSSDDSDEDIPAGEKADRRRAQQLFAPIDKGKVYIRVVDMGVGEVKVENQDAGGLSLGSGMELKVGSSLEGASGLSETCRSENLRGVDSFWEEGDEEDEDEDEEEAYYDDQEGNGGDASGGPEIYNLTIPRVVLPELRVRANGKFAKGRGKGKGKAKAKAKGKGKGKGKGKENELMMGRNSAAVTVNFLDPSPSPRSGMDVLMWESSGSF